MYKIVGMLISIFTFIGWFLTISGLLVILIGVVGFWRLTGFFSQIHANGLIDSFGLPLTLLGLAFLQTNLIASSKLILMILLVLLLNPTSTHALAILARPREARNIDQRD